MVVKKSVCYDTVVDSIQAKVSQGRCCRHSRIVLIATNFVLFASMLRFKKLDSLIPFRSSR